MRLIGIGLLTALLVSIGFGVLFLPFGMFSLIAGGFTFVFAVPLTVVVLPLAAWLSRGSQAQPTLLIILGFGAGAFSPLVTLFAWLSLSSPPVRGAWHGVPLLITLGSFGGCGASLIFLWLVRRPVRARRTGWHAEREA